MFPLPPKNINDMQNSKNMTRILLLVTLLFASDTFAQKLESEFLYKISLSLDEPIDTGKSPFGTRIVYSVKGGTFEGPEIRGIVKADYGSIRIFG